MWPMEHLERVILGANASTTLGGGACGADPLDAAAIFHELDITVARIVQLDRLTLPLGVEKGLRSCKEREKKEARRTEQVSKVSREGYRDYIALYIVCSLDQLILIVLFYLSLLNCVPYKLNVLIS